jgi:hypothetical protein
MGQAGFTKSSIERPQGCLLHVDPGLDDAAAK